jgi:hypothetical protein
MVYRRRLRLGGNACLHLGQSGQACRLLTLLGGAAMMPVAARAQPRDTRDRSPTINGLLRRNIPS